MRWTDLSPREREVLDLMAQGWSNRGIAQFMFCSNKTVESHVGSIFLKLGLEAHPLANRRVAAVVGWIEGQDPRSQRNTSMEPEPGLGSVPA